MAKSNSVFISYRRDISGYTALAVFQYLTAHGIDTFVDHKRIPAGRFEEIILGEIAARPYFVVILAPGCLKRCKEPGDWLRREIEHAVACDRLIIPLMTSGFDFRSRNTKPYLTGQLERLRLYQGLDAPLDLFDAAMERLRTHFLVNIDRASVALPASVRAESKQTIKEAAAEPVVTKQMLSAQDYFERAYANDDTDPDGKIADYTEAIRLNPRLAEAYVNRGIAHREKGDLDRTIADYNAALKLKPQDSQAYNNRGWAKFLKKDFEGAIADCTAAIRLARDYAPAYHSRGSAYAAKGNISAACADYQKALRLLGARKEALPEVREMALYIAAHCG